MTNDEIMKEVKSTFNLEGMEMSKEQEKRLSKYLNGEMELEDIIEKLKEKYRKYDKI